MSSIKNSLVAQGITTVYSSAGPGHHLRGCWACPSKWFAYWPVQIHDQQLMLSLHKKPAGQKDIEAATASAPVSLR